MTPANLANCSISEVGTLKVTIIRGTNWIRGVHNTIDVLSSIYPPSECNDEARFAIDPSGSAPPETIDIFVPWTRIS